ncbi:MAG: UbiD family decarboxylase [Chloroflexi bacterium]|nr:UbiD family decarboxylase [Chloroflexota bacterium]
MIFNDLREFLQRADELGLCKTVDGADWQLEVGAITELGLYVPDAPLLVFDNIKGYSAGYRVVSNFLNTPKLVALAFGLPLDARGTDQVRAWRDTLRDEFKPMPPVEVQTGPVMENVHTGDDVDLFEFPVPLWHERDGGRYIGTGNMVIQRDPDDGWVNLGTYRVQAHDKNTATVYNSPGRHGDEIRKKYWSRGLACPVAVTCGQDPVLWSMAHSGIPQKVGEYDYAGWLRGEPIEVVKGPITGLPVPATAEIVLEGEMLPPGTETRTEGPFGEWTGYYASGSRSEPVFRVKAVLHRNDPILLGAPPQMGPYDFWFGKNIMRAAILWKELDKNVPGVKGVWLPPESRGPSIIIAAIQQQYAGHAKQAANFLSGSYQGAYMCRMIIIVDDDIDPSSFADVWWALGTRCEPETSIDVLRGCWGSPLDPTLPPDKRSQRDFTHSQAVILACKPFHWIKEFPAPVKSSPELLRKTREKWGEIVFGGVRENQPR